MAAHYDREVQPVTTLMLRNLPCRMSHKQVAKAIRALGFGRKYDFLRLVAGNSGEALSKTNMGFGFINFKEPEDAAAFMQAFHGYQFEGSRSLKRCLAQPARVQGFDAILEKLRIDAGGNPLRGFFTASI